MKTRSNYTKRVESCATKSRLVLVLLVMVLVLLLIGRESGASFLSQSLSVVMQNQSNANYFRHSSENRSIEDHYIGVPLYCSVSITSTANEAPIFFGCLWFNVLENLKLQTGKTLYRHLGICNNVFFIHMKHISS